MTGVSFPTGAQGRRSTTATGRAIFADSVRAVDPALAARIEHTDDWRGRYIEPVRDIVERAAHSPESALSIAREGLASIDRRFLFTRDTTTSSVPDAMAQWREPGFGSVVIEGGQLPERELSLPYRGRRLFGDELRRQVDAWVRSGIAEPSFATAMHTLLDHPEWLDLTGVDIAVLGAGAEMGPTRSLLRWGATVHAVDLPGPATWQRLIGITRGTAGSLRIPIALQEGRAAIVTGGIVRPDDDASVAEHAGADLLTRTPEIRTWLAEIDRPFTLGSYAYAEGAAHALLSVACDAIAADLAHERSDVMLAFLATPTDAFAVPMDAVVESRRRWEHRGLGALLQAPLRVLRQFAPNYPMTFTADDGREFGLNDSLIPQQGPNYVLAKRIQRWRAITARAAGHTVSLNIAPATRTQSVVRSRALAAAYAGADRFGVEVFEPATSSALMAALLVHDLRNPASAAHADVPLVNPMDLYAQSAIHGGLWRAAYAPRSVLGIAAVLGLIDARA